MGKELELTSSSYALKVNAKEATELHYGCPVEGRWNICLCDVLEGRWNICLCDVCQRQIEEDEEMWFVSEINEVLCEECFKEFIEWKYPHFLHKIHLIG